MTKDKDTAVAYIPWAKFADIWAEISVFAHMTADELTGELCKWCKKLYEDDGITMIDEIYGAR